MWAALFLLGLFCVSVDSQGLFSRGSDSFRGLFSPLFLSSSRRDVQAAPHDRWYTQLFDEPITAPGWVNFFDNGVYRQRYLIASGQNNLFCETRVRLRATPDLVVAALRSAWTWWRFGAQDDRRVQADGTITYVLWPALAFGTRRTGVRVEETMGKPELLPGGGYRIPIALKGSCEGQAYFLIESDGAGGAIVRGRFAGVQNKVAFMTQRIFVETHLKAERGALGFPFKAGTGWPGLKDLVERGTAGVAPRVRP